MVHRSLDTAHCSAPLPSVQVRAGRVHTIVVQPRVICARILELLFDTNKSFLLPSALEHIREIRKLYDTRPRAKVLIVGHTDITGEPDVNDPLSLNRAKAVQAYVTDDVKAWLDFYEDHMHAKARWGPHEDHLMLQAVLAESGEDLTDTPLRHFQATRGLAPDGKLGPITGVFADRLRLLFGRFPLQWVVTPGEHLRYWTRADFGWWAEQMGFRLVRAVPYEGTPWLKDVWPSLFAAAFVYALVDTKPQAEPR